MAVEGPFRPDRRIDPLQILTEASEVAAHHPLNLDDLLRDLAKLVRKVADYQLFAVLLAEPDGDLAIRYSIGYRADLAQRLRVRPGEGITGDAAKRRRTVVVDDVRADPRYLMAVEAVRSEIAAPLVARGKLVGVIDLQSARPGAFDEETRSVLELIASRFSLAIDAALLFEQSIRQNATLKTLAAAAQEFSSILALEELLHKISALVRNLVRYDAFSIYLLEEGRLEHYFGVRFDERVQWKSLRLGQGIVGAAAKEARTISVRDTSQDERYVAAVEGIRSEVSVPLMLKDAVIGVIDLESEQVGSFEPDHIQALELLAPQVAAAIDNARLYERVARDEARLRLDLTAARHLQKLLLPGGFPQFEGIEVAARSLSAVEVSGDFFEFFERPGERFTLVNGDVTGKGAAAALYAALASGLLPSLAAKFLEPRALLEALNQGLLARPLDARYLVAIVACWLTESSELVVASSGQPRPAVRRGGKAEYLDIGGTPLGLIDPGVYDEVRVQLAPGDVFVTASDGLHETEDSDGLQYGEERLCGLLEECPDADARELLDRIFEDARLYSGEDTPFDDRTVVVLRVK